jgi:hypothetical protein
MSTLAVLLSFLSAGARAATLCNADYLIKKLNLQLLQKEVGYFYQTYKSSLTG